MPRQFFRPRRETSVHTRALVVPNGTLQLTVAAWLGWGLLFLRQLMARHAGGWVKLHRKILTSWIGRDSAALSIFCTLVMWANRRDGIELLKGQLTTLKIGQVATSPQELAAQLKLGAKLVERRLAAFEKDGAIVQQVSSKGRIITLVKYVRYQLQETDNVLGMSSTEGAQGKQKSSAGGHSGEDREVPSGGEVTSNPPKSPPAGGKVKAAAKISKRELRHQADDAAVEVFDAVTSGLSPQQLEAQLSPRAQELALNAYSSWNKLSELVREAGKTQGLTRLAFAMRFSFHAAARRLANENTGPPGDKAASVQAH